MWWTWHIISPLSEKVGGRVPRDPHLIVPMFYMPHNMMQLTAPKFGMNIAKLSCRDAGKLR